MPTTRNGALAAIVTGRRAVYTRESKRSSGPGTERDFYALTADRIRTQPPASAHYTEHVCGTTDPPPPAPLTAWPALDIDPPF